MLDVNRQIHIPGYANLVIYADRESTDRVYGFALPHLSELDSMVLLTYQKKNTIVGGQLSLTISLGLLDSELNAVQAFLVVEDGSPVRLIAPSWTDGKVTVKVGDIITLNGKPSLIGDNVCSLNAMLSAEEADAVSDLWNSSDGRLTLEYDVEFLGQNSIESIYTPDSSTTVNVYQSNSLKISKNLTNTLDSSQGQRKEIKY